MGAWFSLGFEPHRIGDDILAVVGMSKGSRTAPPLAVAAAVMLGSDAVPALNTYVERDVSGGDGSAAFVAAVVESLDGEASTAPADSDRAACSCMVNVARRLREALLQG